MNRESTTVHEVALSSISGYRGEIFSAACMERKSELDAGGISPLCGQQIIVAAEQPVADPDG
jgi:hypothetical protein